MSLSDGFIFELEKISPRPGDIVFIKVISPDWTYPSADQMTGWIDAINELNVDAEFVIYCDGSIEKIKTVRSIGEILPYVCSSKGFNE